MTFDKNVLEHMARNFQQGATSPTFQAHSGSSAFPAAQQVQGSSDIQQRICGCFDAGNISWNRIEDDMLLFRSIVLHQSFQIDGSQLHDRPLLRPMHAAVVGNIAFLCNLCDQFEDYRSSLQQFWHLIKQVILAFLFGLVLTECSEACRRHDSVSDERLLPSRVDELECIDGEELLRREACGERLGKLDESHSLWVGCEVRLDGPVLEGLEERQRFFAIGTGECVYAVPDDVCVITLWLRSELESQSEAAGLSVAIVVRNIRQTGS